MQHGPSTPRPLHWHALFRQHLQLKQPQETPMQAPLQPRVATVKPREAPLRPMCAPLNYRRQLLCTFPHLHMRGKPHPLDH